MISVPRVGVPCLSKINCTTVDLGDEAHVLQVYLLGKICNGHEGDHNTRVDGVNFQRMSPM